MDITTDSALHKDKKFPVWIFNSSTSEGSTTILVFIHLQGFFRRLERYPQLTQATIRFLKRGRSRSWKHWSLWINYLWNVKSASCHRGCVIFIQKRRYFPKEISELKFLPLTPTSMYYKFSLFASEEVFSLPFSSPPLSCVPQFHRSVQIKYSVLWKTC